MRGRAPKPAKVKSNDGNTGGHAFALDWTAPLKELPPPPPELVTQGVEIWNKIGPQLIHDKLISQNDLLAFAIFCSLFDVLHAIDAELKLYRTGPIIIRDGKPMANPLYTMKIKLATQLRAYSAEFGLTPSARGRSAFIGLGKKDGRPKGVQRGAMDPLSEFLSPGMKGGKDPDS